MSYFSIKCPFHVFVAGAFSSSILITSSFIIYKTISKRIKNKHAIPNSFYSSRYINELKVAVQLALTTGRNIKAVVDKIDDQVIENKGVTGIDFVTKTDKENELYIFTKLREQFPNFQQIGEESSSILNELPELTNEPTWIVDPIDGTTNFVHKFPCSCVSIALVDNKQSVVGVVYEPFNDELFLAVKGFGSYLNGKQIKVSKASSISSSLILTEFGYDRIPNDLDNGWNVLRKFLLKNVHGVRMLGSAVVDLCYISTGRLDALYSGISGGSWKPWDYAAGVLILSEAGGYICDINGDNFNLYSPTIIATSTKELADEIKEVINSK